MISDYLEMNYADLSICDQRIVYVAVGFKYKESLYSTSEILFLEEYLLEKYSCLSSINTKTINNSVYFIEEEKLNRKENT